MIRRFSHIILALLLLSTTTGMAISKHFCGDSLVSTVLFGEADSCCDSGSCCQNESSFYQLNEDFSAPAFAQIPQTLELELFIAVGGPDIQIFGASDENSFLTEREPPLQSKIQTALSLKQAWLL